MNKKTEGNKDIINKDIINKDEIDLRELFRIFIKRKWWFIGTFLVILIAGLLFTFLRTQEYTSTSILKVKEDYCLDSIGMYFPEEASELKIGSLNDASIELKLRETLSEATKALNYNIDRNDLDKAINVSIDKEKQILIITTTYSNPEIACKMNETLLGVYGKKKNSEFNEAYDKLLQKVEARLADIQKEIEELSSRAEEYTIGFNVRLLNEIEKSGSGIPFSGANYTSPEITGKLNNNLIVSTDLNRINFILAENKELFVNKIEIIENPEISDAAVGANYIRNVLITIFLAVIIGFAVVFLANYFMGFRMQK